MKLLLTEQQINSLRNTLAEADFNSEKAGRLFKFLSNLANRGKETDVDGETTDSRTETMGTPSTESANGMSSPLENTPNNITRGFQSGHYAIDYPVSSGTEVLAPADGTVVVAKDTSPNRCGGHVAISHSFLGKKTKFCHLKDWTVSVGDKVKKGQVIGHSGGGKYDPHAGHSTGSHLHYQITDMNDNPINPE